MILIASADISKRLSYRISKVISIAIKIKCIIMMIY